MMKLRGEIIATYVRNAKGELVLGFRTDQRRAPSDTPLDWDDTVADVRDVGSRKYWQYARGEY